MILLLKEENSGLLNVELAAALEKCLVPVCNSDFNSNSS
jgi:hypothetical protein